MLGTWLYVSTAKIETDTETEIANIRGVAEVRNPELGLTGVLLFSRYQFAQFLEGPAEGLDLMKSSIFADDRHFDILTLTSKRAERRRYRNWSLAYSGWSMAIERAIARAAHNHDGRDLLAFMDAF